MIEGISIYEILTLSSVLFFIGVYGFFTRENLITVLMSIELILNAAAVNFVIVNTYLYPDFLQGAIFSIFIVPLWPLSCLVKSLTTSVRLFWYIHKT